MQMTRWETGRKTTKGRATPLPTESTSNLTATTTSCRDRQEGLRRRIPHRTTTEEATEETTVAETIPRPPIHLTLLQTLTLTSRHIMGGADIPSDQVTQ